MEADKPATDKSNALAELVAGARDFGLALSSESVARFDTYLETLLLWNRRASLTAARTPLAIVRSHILDSLAVVRFVQAGFRVADLGSGAGFPGIPVAIVCARSTVALIESRRKKASFLREVARRVPLANVEIVEERAEAWAQRSDGAYDATVSRAVMDLGAFLRVSHPLLRSGGLAVAMKGPQAAVGAPVRGFGAAEVVEYRLVGEQQRVLLVYHKE
jgi:16S rRNA (guanine527-N7)-methyltransferase